MSPEFAWLMRFIYQARSPDELPRRNPMNEENRQKLSQLAERAWTNETLKNELLTEPTLAIQKRWNRDTRRI